MGLVAHLYKDGRWAERHPVERDATLRDPDWAPIDVTVEDLSESGFSVTTGADLTIGAEIGLGLSGIGLRRARVVRRAESLYGCEFLIPLTREELRWALAAPSAAPVPLPGNAAAFGPWTNFGPEEEHPARLPLRMRALSIILGGAVAWLAVIALGWAIIGLVR